jgi:hypothetical protein
MICLARIFLGVLLIVWPIHAVSKGQTIALNVSGTQRSNDPFGSKRATEDYTLDFENGLSTGPSASRAGQPLSHNQLTAQACGRIVLRS